MKLSSSAGRCKGQLMFWHTHALKMTLATCSSCAIGEKAMEDNASPITLQERRNCTIQSVIQKQASCVISHRNMQSNPFTYFPFDQCRFFLLHLLLGAQVLILMLSHVLNLRHYLVPYLFSSGAHESTRSCVRPLL